MSLVLTSADHGVNYSETSGEDQFTLCTGSPETARSFLSIHQTFSRPGAHPGVDSGVVSTQPRPHNAGLCRPRSQGQALATAGRTPALQERAREQRLGLRPWTRLLAQSTAHLLLQRDRLGPQRLGAQPKPAGSLGGAPESSACWGEPAVPCLLIQGRG